jgi:hypothetical protein
MGTGRISHRLSTDFKPTSDDPNDAEEREVSFVAAGTNQFLSEVNFSSKYSTILIDKGGSQITHERLLAYLNEGLTIEGSAVIPQTTRPAIGKNSQRQKMRVNMR